MSKKENLTRILLCVSIIALSLCGISWINRPRIIDGSVIKYDSVKVINVAYSNDTIKQQIDTVTTVKIDSIELLKDSIKQKMINEVHKLMKRNAPNYRKEIVAKLVSTSLDCNIDLCFMLSQTQLETNFGTTGIGKNTRKKSIFGVYRTYTNYNKCIDDYAKILKTSYLGKGKTEQDLLNRYVTHGGARYAGNKNYENELKQYYRAIKGKTNIYTLQKRYKELS